MNDFFSKLMELSTSKQLSLIITLITLLPITYSVMYLCDERFEQCDLFNRIVFAVATTITSVFTIYFFGFAMRNVVGNSDQDCYFVLGINLIAGGGALVASLFFTINTFTVLIMLVFVFIGWCIAESTHKPRNPGGHKEETSTSNTES